jgi:hypothetical protein
MKPNAKDITRLAKATHASHYRATIDNVESGRRIPWKVVEELWTHALPKERYDYRFEARQVLNTLHAGRLRGFT